MNMENSNQPAFPLITNGGAIQDGLTKREYFAAMAMQGLFSNPSEVPLKTVREALGLPETAEYLYPEHWNRYQAICAANAADALLEELNRAKK